MGEHFVFILIKASCNTKDYYNMYVNKQEFLKYFWHHKRRTTEVKTKV